MKKIILSSLLALVLVMSSSITAFANDPGDEDVVTKYVTVNSLNVRAQASQNGRILGHLQKGDEVYVYADNYGWATIGFKGGVAYVFSDYIKAKQEPSKPVDATMYCSPSMSNVRAGAGLGYPVIGHITQGEAVSVFGKDASGNWYEIHYYEGVGYVAANNLTSNEPGAAPANSTPGNYATYKVVCPSAVNVRTGPGVNYAVKGHVYNGADVLVSEVVNGWATIQFEGGTGFMSAQYLQAA